MGGFAAFGSGFFNQLNKNVDDAKDEERELRKSMMLNWTNNTLPKIQKAREEDDRAYQLATQYETDPRMNGRKDVAYWAARGKVLGEWDDLGGFFEKWKLNPGMAPAHINETSKKEAESTYRYNPTPVPASDPIEGSQKPSFWSKLSGKGSPATAMGEARESFQSAYGVDPTAPVRSSFLDKEVSTPEGLIPIDKDARELQNLAIKTAISDPDRVRPELWSKAMSALQAGNREDFAKITSDPKFRISTDEVEAKAMDKSIRTWMIQEVSKGNLKEDALTDIVSGKGSVGYWISKSRRTPEEKARLEAKANMIEDASKNMGSADKVRLYKEAGILNELGLEDSQIEAITTKAEEIGKENIDQAKAARAAAMKEALAASGRTSGFIADPPKKASKPKEEAPVAPVVTPKKEEKSVILGQTPETIPDVDKAVVDGDSDMIKTSDPFEAIKAFKRNRTKISNPETIARSIRVTPEAAERLNDDQFKSTVDLRDIAPHLNKANSREEAAYRYDIGEFVMVKDTPTIITAEDKEAANKLPNRYKKVWDRKN